MPETYKRQWRKYRRRHWAATLGLVLGFPGSVLIAIGLRKITGQDPGLLVVATVLPWLAFWTWLAFRVARFPCPRCGVPFLANQESDTEMKKSGVCSKCGLKLYQEL